MGITKPWEEWDTSDLAALMDGCDEEIKRQTDIKGHAEQVLARRMEEVGAKAIPNEAWEIVAKYGSPVYLEHVLRPGLGELLSPAVLAEVYTPAHDETEVVHYDAKWDGKRLPGFAKKYGTDVAAIIEAGTTRKFAGVTVTRRK